MVMSTPTLAEASGLLSGAVLVDTISIYEQGPTRTTGIHVTRGLTLVQAGVAALVQTTTLANAVESRTDSVYSIKVAQATDLQAGHIVEVNSCTQEPELVGKRLLVDKVSLNGLALLRKAVAADWTTVDQQGKGGLA